MTIVAVCSVKGSPGATTFACLLAAAWPTPQPLRDVRAEADHDESARPRMRPSVPVAVVEADQAGGDLAARFALSSRIGWSSLSSASRRSQGAEDITDVRPHLQRLPGGLPVLVAARGEDRCRADSPAGAMICAAVDLVVVDLGRLREDDSLSASWLRLADHVVLVVRGDAAGAIQVRERAPRLLGGDTGRTELVVVGGDQTGNGVAEFVGFPLLGALPDDTRAAHVASGMSSAGRKLDRSLLWSGVTRIATTMARSDIDTDGSRDDGGDDVVIVRELRPRGRFATLWTGRKVGRIPSNRSDVDPDGSHAQPVAAPATTVPSAGTPDPRLSRGTVGARLQELDR